MFLTIQSEANRLYNIFKNSYDYFLQNLLTNKNIDLYNDQDISNRIKYIMPAGGFLTSFISGLYFEKNVKYLNNRPLEDKDYAFTKLVISSFIKKSVIFLVGRWGNYGQESYERIYSDHRIWIIQVIENIENEKFNVIEEAPHKATLSFLDVYCEDWGWNGGGQYSNLIGAINQEIGEKKLYSVKHDEFTRNIIKQI